MGWRYWAMPFTFIGVLVEEIIRLWPEGDNDEC